MHRSPHVGPMGLTFTSRNGSPVITKNTTDQRHPNESAAKRNSHQPPIPGVRLRYCQYPSNVPWHLFPLL
jgi:hypothetical protein